MPLARINGINLNYDEYGAGETVLLVSGTATRGSIWRTYQVPALAAAGYRVVTFDNRGVPPTDSCDEGFDLSDMVADTIALLERLGGGRCRLIGYSLGAIIVQELLLARPDLVTQAVLMATRGRSDVLSTAMTLAEVEVLDRGVVLPARYQAAVRVLNGFSPRTLRDERTVRDWLDTFEIAAGGAVMSRSQLCVDLIPDCLARYRDIEVDCLVIGFADDLLARPNLCREVADSIPGCGYEEIPGCGHYGFIEEPDKVNSVMIDYFAKGMAG